MQNIGHRLVLPILGKWQCAPNALRTKDDAMSLPRRRFLQLTAGTAALPLVSRNAGARDYPTRPVRIIVGFGAGGTLDIIARLWGQWLSERFGQPFVVENRPGGGGNVGAEGGARAPPEGYTLLLLGSPNMIHPTLYE